METTTIYSSHSAGSVEVASSVERGGMVADSPIPSGDTPSVEAHSQGKDIVLHLTLSQLSEAIAAALGSVKIYVLESDISEAQRAVRAVVEESQF